MAPMTPTCGELWRELSLPSEQEPLLEQELPLLTRVGRADKATCGLEKQARAPPRPPPAARGSLVPVVVSIARVSTMCTLGAWWGISSVRACVCAVTSAGQVWVKCGHVSGQVWPSLAEAAEHGPYEQGTEQVPPSAAAAPIPPSSP
eukprot:scaffold32438_cov28-Phaeocystis_antarctica.AAC.1